MNKYLTHFFTFYLQVFPVWQLEQAYARARKHGGRNARLTLVVMPRALVNHRYNTGIDIETTGISISESLIPYDTDSDRTHSNQQGDRDKINQS